MKKEENKTENFLKVILSRKYWKGGIRERKEKAEKIEKTRKMDEKKGKRGK